MPCLMRPIGRLAVTLVAAVGVVTVGLWLGLEFGAGYDLATASTAAGVGSAAFVAAVGAALAVSNRDPRSGSGPVPKRDAGFGRVTKKFVDRVDELGGIQNIVGRGSSDEDVRAVITIHGMPGTGKSEFAVHAANNLLPEFRRYARRKHLKLVTCKIKLHAHEGLSRTDPRDVLHHKLRLNGPDPERAKMSLDALSDEWQEYLQDKLAILVIDNAADEEQVESLLPGDSPHIVLVTSRRELVGLEATSYPLKTLPEEEATQMIINIVDRRLGHGEQAAAGELAKLCDCNPQAIKWAVSPLAGKNDASLTGRLGEFRRTPNRLLVIDEQAGTRGRGVAWSFGLSYQQLTDHAKLVLRRLALAPFPVVGVKAATALVGQSDDVVLSLRELAAEALLDEVSRDRAVYEMHDLTREYARILANRDDTRVNQAAINGLLAYYWAAAEYADEFLTRQRPPVAIEPPEPTVSHDLSDLSSVIRWVREGLPGQREDLPDQIGELSNLLACADYAFQQAEGNDDRDSNAWVVLFASALAGILRNESQWRRSIELQTRAIKCAQKINVPLGMANALSERGLLCRLASELERAEADLEQAITIYSGVDSAEAQRGKANALNTLGVVVDQRDRKDEARRRLDEALEIYRSLGDELGEANVLQDQGMTELFADNYDQAIQLMGRALALYTTKDQPLGMSHASFYLARAQRNIGDETGAEKSLESARMLYHDLGNKLGESNVLVQLGAVLRARDPGLALNRLNELVELSAEIGNQMTRMAALDQLGEIYLESGDSAAAHEAWSRALQVAREYGVRREETKFAGKVRQVR
jgi:tetratricopeptide (TPR) repeat protein